MKTLLLLILLTATSFAQSAKDLCKQLVGDGSGNDAAARTKLMKLTHNAAKIEGAERVQHEAALLECLKSNSSFEVSTFLIQQLDLCGGKATVQALAKYLNHPMLGANATRTLTNLARYDQSLSREILLEAYKNGNDSSKPYLLNAISILKYNDSESLKIFRSSLELEELKPFALQGLAQFGDGKDSKTFLSSLDKAVPQFRGKAFHLNLIYAEKLGLKNKSEANNHLNQLKSRIHKNEVPYFTAVASVDFKINGVSDAWLDALPKENPHTQVGVVRILQANPGLVSAAKLVGKCQQNPNEPVYMEALAAVDAAKAAPFVLKGLSSSNKDISEVSSRLAINYGSEFAPSLISSLIAKGSATESDISMAKSMVSSKNAAAITKLWDNLSPQLSLAMIEITETIKSDSVAEKMLQSVSSSDKKVQKAALKALKNVVSAKQLDTLMSILAEEKNSSSVRYLQQAVSASVAQAADEKVNMIASSLSQKRDDKLLEAFAKSNRKEALPLLKADLESGSADIQKETIKTLSGMSPDISTELLLLAVEKSGEERNRILAARALAEAAVNSTGPVKSRKDIVQKALKLNLPENEKNLLKEKLKAIK